MSKTSTYTRYQKSIIYKFPTNTSTLERCKPIYEEFPGWTEPTASATRLEDLPDEAIRYVKRLEELVGVRIDLISTGPKREETIHIHPIIPTD